MKAHPRKIETTAYAVAHPEVTYVEVGKIYGVDPALIANWVQRAREREGTAIVPLRTTKSVSPTTPKNLTLLPPPPPKPLDPELTSLARDAARALLLHLGNPLNHKGQPLKDIAASLKVITDSYELLPQVEGKDSGTKAVGSRRLVEALMGGAPGEESGEEEDALDSLVGASNGGVGKS